MSILINVCHVYRCRLLNGSIVTNLFDRVCVYLFQFKAYMYTVTDIMVESNQKNKKRHFFFAHVEMRATRINPKLFPSGDSVKRIKHTNHFMNRLHFLRHFLNFLPSFVAIFSTIHIYYRWLPQKIKKDKRTFW